MKKLFFCVLISTHFIYAEGFLQGYGERNHRKCLEHAYELNAIASNPDLYNPIIAWLDNELEKNTLGLVYHLEAVGIMHLPAYVGLIYYMSEHAKSPSLKQKFVTQLALLPFPIAKVIQWNLFEPFHTVAEMSERRFTTSWWQWRRSGGLEDEKFDIEQLRYMKNDLDLLLKKYGDFYISKPDGSNPRPLNSFGLAVCSRLLSTTAKLGVQPVVIENRNIHVNNPLLD